MQRKLFLYGVGKSSLARNSMALITGTVATQGIAFLLSPVLARIFGLADFGNLANYNAWVAILALLSCLRYEHAVIVAGDRDTTNSVLGLTGLLCLGSVAVYALAGVLIYLLNPPGYLSQIHGLIPFIPIGVLAVCVSSPLVQLNIKAGRFNRLAVVAIVQMACTLASQILLGMLHVDNGLIIGTIAGYAAAAGIYGALVLADGDLRGIRRVIGWHRLRATAMQYLNFPRYTLPADAIGVVTQQFIPVFILALFSPAIAGLYAFALRIVRIPLFVVATAIASALKKGAVDHLEETGRLDRLVRSTVKVLFAVAVLPFLLMLTLGRPIFEVVLGHRWSEAGHIVQILSPGILLEFVALPLSVIFLVTNTQRYTFVTQSVGFLLMLGALIAGRYLFQDFIVTCYLISAAMLLANGATLFFGLRVADRHRVDSLALSCDVVEPTTVGL